MSGTSTKLTEPLEFRMLQANLLKLSAELDMVGRSSEERQVAQIIFGLRYKELVNMLVNTDDFNPDEILLSHKCKQILPQTEQWGALVLTHSSLHFYPLINCKPKKLMHISFQNINVCMKYRYQGKSTGLRIELYSSVHPLIFLLGTEEQREEIFKYIKNKIKFKNPLENLVEYTDQWVYGKLSNFEYLMVLNNLANRSAVDFSQYPVFPWVIARYSGAVNLNDKFFFRDLKKHVGAIDSSRYLRMKVFYK